jgi:hypothetical protein
MKALAGLGLGFGSLCSLYLLFNLYISGSPLPNTFYAKQAEYAASLALPFFTRFIREVSPVLKGIGVVLLAGVVYLMVTALRRKNWAVLAVFLWFVGFLALYAWQLPVTYQYGRYIMPSMPIYFLLGLIGLVEFSSVDISSRWRWIISISWKLAAVGVLVLFWALGAYHYAQDVAIIESEMVASAKWVSSNVPPGELVAAHDIGALGFFGGHNLLDLAGLVTPEVIPFLRDENRIAAYLDKHGVTYLVVFPDWYAHLTSGLTPVFSTGAPFAPALGGSNMVVFSWPAH